MLGDYVPILLILVLAVVLAAGMMGLSAVVGPIRKSKRKLSPYESGIPPTGDTRGKFSIKYYLIGALFILFDVEAVFLIAWAVVFKELGFPALIEIIVFLIVVLGGYFYIVKKGALEWE